MILFNKTQRAWYNSAITQINMPQLITLSDIII